LDVKTNFLHGNLEEEIYIGKNKTKIVHLKKDLSKSFAMKDRYKAYIAYVLRE